MSDEYNSDELNDQIIIEEEKPLEPFSLVDFNRYPSISQQDKDKIKDKVNTLLSSFSELFYQMTDKALRINIENISDITFEESNRLLSSSYSFFYTREFLDNHDQLLVSLSPTFVDNTLINTTEVNKDTFIKKSVATHFVTDIFKQLIIKNPSSDFREVSLSKGNIPILPTNRRYGSSNLMVAVELSTQIFDRKAEEEKKAILEQYEKDLEELKQKQEELSDQTSSIDDLETSSLSPITIEEPVVPLVKEEKKIENSILITATLNGWLKLLGTKKGVLSDIDYATHNGFAILREVNVNDEHIHNLKIGEKIIFSTPLSNSIPYVVNKKYVANGTVVCCRDNNTALLFNEEESIINTEDKDYFIDNPNNLFLILGSNIVGRERIEELKTTTKPTLEIFSNHYNEDLPLIYKGKIIALGNLVPTLFNNYVKITKVYDDPLTIPSLQ